MADHPSVKALEEFLLEDLARLAALNRAAAATATEPAVKTHQEQSATQLEAAAALITAEGGANETYSAGTAEALRIYTRYMQQSNSFTKWQSETSGNYTIDYAAHLATLMNAQYVQMMNDLAGKTSRTPQEEDGYQTLRAATDFQAVMKGVIDAGIYIQPASTNQNAMDINQARPILQAALNNFKDLGETSFDVNLQGGFTMEARMATQMLLIDMQEQLGLPGPDTGNPYDGRYRSSLRSSLATALQDPAKAQLIADRYLDGNASLVPSLLLSLDSYAGQPPIAGLDSDITTEILIRKPAMTHAEVAQLGAAIDRLPAPQLAGTNALFLTMTGYGIEDLVPTGSLNPLQESALQAASDDPQVALQAMFAYVLEESEAVAAGDPEKLRAEMNERIMFHLNTVIDDNPAFNLVRAQYLREYVRVATDKALDAYEAAEGSLEQQQNAAAVTFADKIPGMGEFIAAHGPQNRDVYAGDAQYIRNAPAVMPEYAGAIEQRSATREDVLALPLLQDLLIDIRRDAPSSRAVAEADTAIAELRDHIIETFGDRTEPAVIRSQSGENFFVSRGAGGALEIRYLNQAGIGEVDRVPVLPMRHHTETDQAMISAAQAGYQALNAGKPSAGVHDPYFFNIGDQVFVAGLDGNTRAFSIVPIDPDFVTMDKARNRVFTNTQELFARDSATYMAEDPAYAFLRGNYAHRLDGYGSGDGVLEAMARATGKTDIAEFFDHPRDFDLRLQENYEVVTDTETLARITLANSQRPETDQTSHFIYMDEQSGRILYVSPEVDINGRYDASKPAVVEDITDPDAYAALRDRILQMDILPPGRPEVTGTPGSIMGFVEWLERGAPPPPHHVRQQGLNDIPPTYDVMPDTGTRYAELRDNMTDITAAPPVLLAADDSIKPAAAMRPHV